MSERYLGGFITASYTGLKVPDAPTIGTATAGNTTANVVFTAPTNSGASNITSYTATSNTGITSSNTSSPIAFTGLTNDIAYTFTVKATNSFGSGPASAASNSVIPTVPITGWYLVQAGGGSGGANDGAGAGGGGGLVIYDEFLFTATSYSVSVGAGGSTGAGTDSYFTHPGGTSTAKGGGQGGNNSEDGNDALLNGGSAGSAGSTGASFPVGSVTQANPSGGGIGYGNLAGTQGRGPYRPGGGGGAGAAGQAGTAVSNKSGDGGSGKEWPIGSGNYYGAGGGGGQHSSADIYGNGGNGGGGRGGGAGNGAAGAPNTGGGGGGSGNAAYLGGAGGSGVVILSYPSTFTASQSGLTMTTTPVGNRKVTTITAGTGTFTLSQEKQCLITQEFGQSHNRCRLQRLTLGRA